MAEGGSGKSINHGIHGSPSGSPNCSAASAVFPSMNSIRPSTTSFPSSLHSLTTWPQSFTSSGTTSQPALRMHLQAANTAGPFQLDGGLPAGIILLTSIPTPIRLPHRISLSTCPRSRVLSLLQARSLLSTKYAVLYPLFSGTATWIGNLWEGHSVFGVSGGGGPEWA